jgi:hypothetical protein
MKNKIILIIIFGLFEYMAYSQKNNNEVVEEPKFKTSFIKRFINENIYFANSNFHWETNYIKYIKVSKYFNSQNLNKTDFLSVGNNLINISAFSIFSYDLPLSFNDSNFTNSNSRLIYYLPIGVKLPILSGKYYNLSLNCDYYWSLNSDKDSEKSAEYYETHYISPNEDTRYNNVPQIIDFNLNMNLYLTSWIELSLFGGYRNQFTEWYGSEYGILKYSNNITGSYYGISMSISTLGKNNIGLEKWEKTKQLNTLNEYNSFLNTYPNSHYTKEVLLRKENLYFTIAMNGKITDCEKYLTVYKDGKYEKQVEDRIEELFFNDAMKGEIKNCEKYFSKFQDGKYKKQVEERIEELYFKDAMKGTFENCKVYLTKFSGGKFINDVNDRIDFLSFNNAMKGTIDDCNDYLKNFKTGKFIDQINKRIETLNNEKKIQEIKYYEQAKNGTIDDCNYYINGYKDGKYYDQILKRRIELIKLEKKVKKNIAYNSIK